LVIRGEIAAAATAANALWMIVRREDRIMGTFSR